jgi:hypothetical protein
MRNVNAKWLTAIVAIGMAVGYKGAGVVAHADEKHPKTTVSIADLAKKKGPKPPSGATYAGIEARPMVGELELPLTDAQVFVFNVKTQSGATLPVKWAYSPNGGTYLWTTAPIQCEDGKTVARGGFVMEIQEDGSGSYALGTRQCPIAHIYGCNFNSQQKETTCGACAWNGKDLACTHE